MTEYVIGQYKNQSFTVERNDFTVNIRLRTFRGIIYMDASNRDGLLISGIRCVNEQFLLPKHIASMIGGNFMFVDINGEYPASENFDQFTCKFLFYTTEEIAEMSRVKYE